MKRLGRMAVCAVSAYGSIFVAVLLSNVLVQGLGQATIEAFPATPTIPLGKSVVLVCKSSGGTSALSYQWSCPGGNCDESTRSQGTPRSRIVDGDTLTVNVASESDAGEYTCTVTGGDSTQTASYTLDVQGGVALYTQAASTPLVVYPSGSVVLSTAEVSSGFFKVSVTCVGSNLTRGQWFAPDGSALSTESFDNARQQSGDLLIGDVEDADYSNGNYKCKVGSEQAVLGLYFRTAMLQGSGGLVANLTWTEISSSSVRLAWSQPSDETLTALGYFVSYGRVDHGVKENVILEGGSTTSVDLTHLQPGVQYEAAVRAFSESDTMDRLVSTEESINWNVTREVLPMNPTPGSSSQHNGLNLTLLVVSIIGVLYLNKN